MQLKSKDNKISHALLSICLALTLFFSTSMHKTSADNAEITILALGDSLTAGYNLPTHAAFPTKLQKSLRKKGFPVHIINAGVSGDTARGGLNRLEWALTEKTDFVILALGANDALRGLDPLDTKKSLGAILNKLAKRHIPVLLVGMYAPENMGRDYTRRFNEVYPQLAEEYKVPLYPFFLDGVALNPKLNLADGIHPNEKGVDVIVKNISPQIEKLLSSILEKKHGKT